MIFYDFYENLKKSTTRGLKKGSVGKKLRKLQQPFSRRGQKSGNPTMTTGMITARRKGHPQHFVEGKRQKRHSNSNSTSNSQNNLKMNALSVGTCDRRGGFGIIASCIFRFVSKRLCDGTVESVFSCFLVFCELFMKTYKKLKQYSQNLQDPVTDENSSKTQ